MDNSAPPANSGLHPIGVVSSRTGLSQDLLRAWERRYEAIVPQRTDSGRRYYSDMDIERLKLIMRALEGGRRISDVARLDLSRLQQLIAEDAPACPPEEMVAPGDALAVRAESPLELPVLETIRSALDRFDGSALEGVLAEASITLSLPQLLGRLLLPLLDEIGRRWSTGELRPAQEHLATTAIRTLLGGLYLRRRPPMGSPVVVVGTPQGQRHELGALMASLSAQESGWDAIYLGPDLPAEDLAAVVRRREARALALSLVYPMADRQLEEELLLLRRALGPLLPILVGGAAAGAYSGTLAKVGARHVRSFEDLRRELQALAATGH
jgi:MerR family transcriptional regulator, light-induced transcriptional regulator